jgi:pseudouridine kinase
MASREQQILTLIREDPMLPQQAIATRLGISRSAVAGHIMNLTHKGLIKGRGYVLSESPFVTVIGGANIDIHGKSQRALLAEDSNPGSVHISAGGVARNIAENLARLGVDCRLISAVGKDHHGQMLLRLSREAGIDMQHVLVTASAPTSTYLSVLDHTGKMQVAIADMNIIDQLNVEFLKPQQAMLSQSALIIVDTNLDTDSIAWLTKSFATTPIFADTVSATKALRLKPHLRFIHTLKTGTLEVEALTGLRARTRKQLNNVADQLHDDGVERVFITRGEHGVFYSSHDGRGTQSLNRDDREIDNVGGAGDAFLAGLAYSWMEDWSIDQTVQFALAAADITLSHAATNNPSLSISTINQLLELQHAG